MSKKTEGTPWKTPKSEFEYFCDRVRHWCSLFSLQDWEVYFQLTALSQDVATVQYDLEARQAQFSYNTHLDNKRSRRTIDADAFHEACELFLASLAVIAVRRTFDRDIMEGEIHRIIHVLQGLLLK